MGHLQFGAVIGSIIPLAENMHNQGSSASDGTFIAFIILMICGSVLANFMLPISKVWKSDGTRVMTKTHPYWKDELIGLGRTLIKEPKILLMFPMFSLPIGFILINSIMSIMVVSI